MALGVTRSFECFFDLFFMFLLSPSLSMVIIRLDRLGYVLYHGIYVECGWYFGWDFPSPPMVDGMNVYWIM